MKITRFFIDSGSSIAPNGFIIIGVLFIALFFKGLAEGTLNTRYLLVFALIVFATVIFMRILEILAVRYLKIGEFFRDGLIVVITLFMVYFSLWLLKQMA